MTVALVRQPRAARARVRSRDAVATRRRLLDAAEHEFAAHGFQGARTRDIAAAAGVQPGLIHHYFGDKHGLYRAMLERALGESSSESFEIMSKGEPFGVMLDRFVAMLLGFHLRHQNLATILRVESQSGSAESALTFELLRATLGPVVAAVERLVEEWQRRGEVRRELAPSDVMVAGLAMCSYPFTERSFLAACLPEAVIDGEESFFARRTMIVELLMRYCRPTPQS